MQDKTETLNWSFTIWTLDRLNKVLTHAIAYTMELLKGKHCERLEIMDSVTQERDIGVLYHMYLNREAVPEQTV